MPLHGDRCWGLAEGPEGESRLGKAEVELVVQGNVIHERLDGFGITVMPTPGLGLLNAPEGLEKRIQRSVSPGLVGLEWENWCRRRVARSREETDISIPFFRLLLLVSKSAIFPIIS